MSEANQHHPNRSAAILYALDGTSKQQPKTTARLFAEVVGVGAAGAPGPEAVTQKELRGLPEYYGFARQLEALALDGLVRCAGKAGGVVWWIEAADTEITLTPEEQQELSGLIESAAGHEE